MKVKDVPVPPFVHHAIGERNGQVQAGNVGSGRKEIKRVHQRRGLRTFRGIGVHAIQGIEEFLVHPLAVEERLWRMLATHAAFERGRVVD